MVLGAARCAFCNLGDIRTVAPGSTDDDVTFVVGFLSEKGRNGGESSESSPASDKGPWGAFEEEYRQRRVYALLRDNGASGSDSDDDELVESSALGDGVVGLGEASASRRCPCCSLLGIGRLDCASDREGSSTTEEDFWTCRIVFADEFRDNR